MRWKQNYAAYTSSSVPDSGVFALHLTTVEWLNQESSPEEALCLHSM